MNTFFPVCLEKGSLQVLGFSLRSNFGGHLASSPGLFLFFCTGLVCI